MQHAAPDSIVELLPALEWTGERYLPWIRNATMSYEHLHRYGFAAQFAKGKRVLDLGSGEGYGANILARTAAYVLGVDIDPVCIQHASFKYNRRNLAFEIGTFAKVPRHPDHSFDLIVCFEAIEHTTDHNALLSEVKRLLKSDGLFIVSTPDKTAYRQEIPEGNPYHVRELELAEFHRLLMSYFRQANLLGQRIFPASSIWPLQADSISVDELSAKQGESEFEYPSDERRKPIYIIGLASDSPGAIGASGSVLIDSSMELMNETGHTIQELARTIEESNEAIDYLRQENGWYLGRIDYLNQTVERLQDCVHATNVEIETIYSSRSWAAVRKWCQFRDFVFPSGSFRKRFLQAVGAVYDRARS